MEKSQDKTAYAVELRRRAKKRLKEKQSVTGQIVTEAELRRLHNELEVHQIELEMQNEELHRAQAETEAVLSKYTDLYDFAPVSYFTLGRDGTILQLNLAGARLLGKERSRLINHRFVFFVSEADRHAFNAFLEKTFTGKTQELWEGVPSQKETSPHFVRIEALVSEDGQECRAVMVDITERKRAEDEIARVAHEWQITFDATNDTIWILDIDQRVLRANKTTERFFQRPSSESIGKHCWEIVHGTTEPVAGCPILCARKSLHREVMEIQIGKGWFEIIADPVLDAAGHYTGSVHIIRDITEHKQAEQEIASLQEQLHQSQKMEAIGRLAGGIAHDFNNLLTVIQGNAQLSILRLREGDPLRENIEEIQKASEGAEVLTRQLLAFSRRQIMEIRVLDLNQILQGLDNMLRRIIGEDIELMTFLSESTGNVKADPGQIEQMIMNIAVNARDAMPDGGDLIIETANVELDEEYARAHIAVNPGRYVMLSLSDTGEGMTQDVKEQIFDPFFTTKERGKGTGLGLSTVYGIVKQSRGSIWVYSEPGKGTTFKIYLPQIDEPLEELKKGVFHEIAGGSETILVVEDEETVRKFVVSVLERQGYRVLDASDGNEALLLCGEFKDSIHLILTDVVMPGMSGRKLVEFLKEISPEIKALYMSGYTDNAIVHHGMLEEGIEFIQKPFTVEKLAGKVREVLDG